MKKRLTPALVALVSLLTLTASLGAFTAAPPSAGASSPDAAPPGFSNPVDVGARNLYDNQTSIGASKAPGDGSVTIGWERRDYEGNANQATIASDFSLGGNFTAKSLSDTDGAQSGGNVRVAMDAQGRRHVVWWDTSGGTCVHYVRLGADNHTQTTEDVDCGNNRKNTAVAAGPDGTAHILAGANGLNIVYYYVDASGVHGPESIRDAHSPYDIKIGVTTNGVVMAAWKGPGQGGQYDIYVATRLGPNNWQTDDISAACCLPGCPNTSKTYLPWLTPDPFGGMRAVWAEQQCDPSPADARDVYYRAWTPDTGWTGHPMVRVTANFGDAYQPSAAVDSTGVTHIAWADYSNYKIYYVYQISATSFSAPSSTNSWDDGSIQKDVSMDSSPNAVHVAYSSDANDSRKDPFYSYKVTSGGSIPTPTPQVPPSATPTVTPRCPNERFHDVCPPDYFYLPVLGLNNLGAVTGINTSPPCVSGADIPCFRPYDNITRGQVAKIVAIASGHTATTSGQLFEDVPPTGTFYPWIQNLANANIVTGYPCGGPGEPCVPPVNRPYFRPNANVTRGQLSKMAALAFGYTDVPTTQTFQDVPTNSPFFQYIGELVSRDLISGYACGQVPSEPCVPPQNRPYFRPNNNVLRGQTAKIIWGAYSASLSTPTPTATSTATSTSTSTPVPPTATSTVTSTAVLTETVVPTLSATAETTLTATSTAVASATATSVPPTVTVTVTTVPAGGAGH